MEEFVITCVVRPCFSSPVPSGPPQNVSTVTTSSTEITVNWGNVAVEKRNGIIKGFKIYYQAVGQFAVDTTEKVKEVRDGNAVQTVLSGLEEYIEYNVTVLAFTSKGDGPNSTEITARTDEGGTCLTLHINFSDSTLKPFFTLLMHKTLKRFAIPFFCRRMEIMFNLGRQRWFMISAFPRIKPSKCRFLYFFLWLFSLWYQFFFGGCKIKR